MTRDRTQVIGAGLALIVLAALVALDLAISPEIAILTPLFGLAPLIACAVVPVRGTAVIATLASGDAILSGVWNESMGTAQQNVRILNVVLIGIAAVAIAAFRVHREHRFVQVSEIAQVAQRAILPLLPAQAGHVAIAARYQSAARGALVGGDLYDCYHSEDHIRIVVGDVRGKGIAGVEQAARVIRAFRQAGALRATLTEVAQEMDDYLAGFFSEEEFVTALLVEATEPGVLRLVSAGHPGPQLVGSDRSTMLELPTGMPLGMGLPASKEAYVETEVPWSPGDRLLMYTDGLSEARNSAGEFFPLSSLAPRIQTGSVHNAIEEVVTAATSHVPGGRLDDDLAIVVIDHLPVHASVADSQRQFDVRAEAGSSSRSGG